MNSSVKDRVKRIREYLHQTQEIFGNSLGLSRASITDIERGKTFPNPLFLENIHNKHKINLNWLICDSGSMKEEGVKNFVEEPESSYAGYKDKYINALEKIEQLNNELIKLKDHLHWYEVNCKCK